MTGSRTCCLALILSGLVSSVLCQAVFPIGKDGKPVALAPPSAPNTNMSGAIMDSIHAAVGSLFPTLGRTAADGAGGGGVPVGAGQADSAPNTGGPALQQLSCSAILELFIQLEVLGYKEVKNSFASPMSIHSALDLVYKGTDGTTKDQLGAVLHYTSGTNSSDLGTQINKFQDEWNQKFVCYKAAEECGDSYLKMDSAVFLDEELKVQPKFATSMVTNRGGQMESLMHMVSFKTAATAAAQINGWVSNVTSSKIKDLISPESIQPGEKMLALNVVYFKGSWLEKFDKAKTKMETFHSPKGDVMVEMMNKIDKFTLHYNQALKYSVLVLPSSMVT